LPPSGAFPGFKKTSIIVGFAPNEPRPLRSIRGTPVFHSRDARAEGSTGLISEHFDPEEFVRAAVGWNRLRLEGEIENELRAAELLADRARVRREQPPHACRAYATFLKRMADWLGTGVAPRHTRRETRALMLTLGQGLLARGQIEPQALQHLQPRKPRSR
jgi:hypothetical protein